MSQRCEILDELQAVSEIISRAEVDLAMDSLINLALLENRVEGLCRRIGTLPASAGHDARPQLIALVHDFDRLGRSIETKLAVLKDQLANKTGQTDLAATHANPLVSGT